MDRSRTPYVVLGMLAIGGNRSGYDIRQAIESSVGHFWNESYGQIYPTLKRLSADGLIQPCPSAGHRLRLEYAITSAGRNHLRNWLAVPFVNDPPRNEFLLKLFFAAEAPPEVALAHIRDLNKRNRDAVLMMEQIQAIAPRANAGEPGLRYWMLTLSLGLAMTRAALQWGEQALADLEFELSHDSPISIADQSAGM